MADMKDARTALGEVFSQCWESEEFKHSFMEDPKKIFEEYGVPYDDSKEYKVIDSPAKTIIHVLPYEGIKQAMQMIADGMLTNVKDVEEQEPKQIIPEGWAMQFVQNTEDTNYIVIPNSPEDMTPEELEMINGGCGFLGLVMIIGVVVAAGGLAILGAVFITAGAAIVLAEAVGGVHAALGVAVTVTT